MPLRILVWWGLFLVSVVLGCIELLDAGVSGNPWAPFDVQLDIVMTSCQIVSAAVLAWIVVRTTGFIEQRAATSTL